MARWFARLMQQGHARAWAGRVGAGFSPNGDGERILDARDARYDAIVRRLRARAAEDREAREKRQLKYRQSLDGDAGPGSRASGPDAPVRLHRFRTKVPCRVTPEAAALLQELREEFAGSTVAFQQAGSGRQAVLLTGGTCTQPQRIGWVEPCVQADPQLCNVRDQGLVVETTAGGTLLVLRFRYPATPACVSSRRDAEATTLPPTPLLPLPSVTEDDVAWVDFTEICPALDLRPSDRGASPRLVWLTRPEAETIDALGSRDYEAFYVRLKLEAQAGIWSTLSGLLSASPGAQWHEGSYYTVVREPDATNGRIYQKTIDDRGSLVDVGLDRIYDASAATDILLLYLGGDLLADFADIYFTLQSLASADAYFLKEEFFSVIRRFWASSQSLTSRYGNELAAVVRMSRRAAPTPAQAPLLQQDWTNLRQSLVDRYGEGGRKAADLLGHDGYPPRSAPAAWPFASFPAGEVNVGLRLVYRQEWRHLGPQRGNVLRTVPLAPQERASTGATRAPGAGSGAEELRRVETTIEQSGPTRNVSDIVNAAARATRATMQWPLEVEGTINTGVRALAAHTDRGLESECRESSRETSTRLTDIMRRMASEVGADTGVVVKTEPGEDLEASPSAEVEATAQDGGRSVYSTLQNRYEVLTRPVELQNIVLVAEKLPAPAEVDLAWVRRHDWILAKVLLDESFRDALDSIRQGAGSRGPAGSAHPQGAPAENIERVETFSASAAVRADGIDMSKEWTRAYRDPAAERLERLQRDVELDAKRDRLYEHLRAHILHYQRAIWQHEDPQQRTMRYRKSGKKVPLEWQFELDSGAALTIDELSERLSATNVDGQFAAYAAGRQADLDQVIDPAGPIGYYGNYAVYRMRPEFGSDDLFGMLHFFKSPYLRPNPETGEPEVADPEEIQIAQDPAVVGASDPEIEQQRGEMIRCVPELRQELARARQKVSDGTDPGALDRLQQPGAARRHFAAYLFRRERARGIALDADGLVIDVVRRAEPAPGSELPQAPQGYELLLDSGREIALLRTNAHRDPGAGSTILRELGEPMPSLLVGAGGGPTPALDPETERIALAPGTGEPTPALRVSRPPDPEAQQVIPAGGVGARMLSLLSGRGHAPEAEGVVVAGSEGDEAPRLLVGRTHDPEAERVILSARAQDSDPEPLILPPGAGGQGRELRAGTGATRAHDREGDPPILASGEPASVGSGRAHDAEAERVILPPGAGEAAPALHAGGAAPRTPDPDSGRLILPPDDDWLRPSPIAG